MNEHKLSYYITESNSLNIEKFEKKIRIAVLSSFTLNGLAETLQVKCAEINIGCLSYVSGYNQYNQEILNSKSQLHAFDPDIVFLIIDSQSLLGNLYYSPYSVSSSKRKEFIIEKFNEIQNLIKLLKHGSRKIVISNFLIPTYSSYGVYECKMDYGIQDMVRDLNLKLSENLRSDSSVYIYDINGFFARFGQLNVFNYAKYYYGDIKIDFDYIPYLAYDLMGYVKPLLGLNRKCIVLDLDNTLWGGVIGEDGFEGIKLGFNAPGNAFVEFQRHLLALQQRGIILAINSKNNYDDALQVIKEHPNMILREEHFASLKINWDDKISNMREIVREINVGLDSMIFFDDDPVNREYMRLNLPEVLTVELPADNSQFTRTLTELNDFNVLKITEEDLHRGKMYFQEKLRTEFEKKAPNLGDFLKQLNIKLKIIGADQFTIPRISQLTLKTNQFNLTTRRYQEEDIEKFSKDKNMLVKCVQVEDKFGDNGITGVMIVRKDNEAEWTIDTFLLSCRIIGRSVETGMLDYILQLAKNEGVRKVNGIYIQSKKNKPCERFLQDSGFKKESEYWVYTLGAVPNIPSHLSLEVE